MEGMEMNSSQTARNRDDRKSKFGLIIPNHIIICGGTSSGKTTFSKNICANNKNIISCGDIIRGYLLENERHSYKRSDLQKIGMSLLYDNSKLADFNNKIIEKLTPDSINIIDGPRLFKTVQFIKDKTGAIVIFLDIDRSIRSTRYHDNMRGCRFDEEEENEIKMGKNLIIKSADLVIRNPNLLTKDYFTNDD